MLKWIFQVSVVYFFWQHLFFLPYILTQISVIFLRFEKRLTTLFLMYFRGIINTFYFASLHAASPPSQDWLNLCSAFAPISNLSVHIPHSRHSKTKQHKRRNKMKTDKREAWKGRKGLCVSHVCKQPMDFIFFHFVGVLGMLNQPKMSFFWRPGNKTQPSTMFLVHLQTALTNSTDSTFNF